MKKPDQVHTTISQEWDLFAAENLPPSLPKEVVDHEEFVFYSGVNAVFTVVMAALDDSDGEAQMRDMHEKVFRYVKKNAPDDIGGRHGRSN